ncbi:MAG: hypothetical protein Q4G45_02060 [Actinomycetia bacterium]|nr:hypothetical protein [Actinomycetes bacterium]
MRPVRAAVSALALALALVLGGCAQGSGAPGTGLVVNGVAVPSSTVDRLTSAVQRVVGSSRGDALDIVVSNLVVGQLADQASQEKNLTITPSDVEAQVSKSRMRDLYADEAARPVAIAHGRWNVVSTQLSDADQEALGRQLTVTLNPRYGVWDMQSFRVDQAPGSLSRLDPQVP